jgi:hypothetical protein
MIMDTADTAALVCYGIVALSSLVSGAAYLLRWTFMPYHRQAVGLPWHELDPRMQALLLALMRGTGGGFVAAGLALAIMLALPFRDGEGWSRWALALVGAAATLPSLYATVSIRLRTGARPPVGVSAAGVGLVALGALLSAV